MTAGRLPDVFWSIAMSRCAMSGRLVSSRTKFGMPHGTALPVSQKAAPLWRPIFSARGP
jgi:hypothetical protein